MDETYIKMCDCPEIQDGHIGAWMHGDYLCDNRQVFVYPVGYTHGSIWLPRQDQLQEMVGLEVLKLTYKFNEFMNTSYNDQKFRGHYAPGGCFTSMEQLWLAFVMKEKFNKTWDGEKWVVAEMLEVTG